MTETIKVKPGVGRNVRLARGHVMKDGADGAADGIVVELTPFVRRRLLFGDLVEVKADTSSPAVAAATTKVTNTGSAA